MSEYLPVVNLVLSSLTFIVVVGGLLTTRNHFKVLRAMSYVERFNGEEGVRQRAVVESWLADPEPERRIELFENDATLRMNVLAFMNLFQELGVAYQRGLLDKKVVADFFDFLAPRYWEALGFLVEHYRKKTGDPAVYRRFKHFQDAMLKAQSR